MLGLGLGTTMNSHGRGIWDGEFGVLATETGGDVLAACLIAGGCFMGLAGHR